LIFIALKRATQSELLTPASPREWSSCSGSLQCRHYELDLALNVWHYIQQQPLRRLARPQGEAVRGSEFKMSLG